MLTVDPEEINLCRAVEGILLDANRATDLEQQLKQSQAQAAALLEHNQQLMEELHSSKALWQAREVVYKQVLDSYGITQPLLPSKDSPCAAAAVAPAATAGEACVGFKPPAQESNEAGISMNAALNSSGIQSSASANGEHPVTQKPVTAGLQLASNVHLAHMEQLPPLLCTTQSGHTDVLQPGVYKGSSKLKQKVVSSNSPLPASSDGLVSDLSMASLVR